MNKLKELRVLSEKSQAEVARQIGVSRVTYIKLERNPEEITVKVAKKIIELFKTPFDEIF